MNALHHCANFEETYKAPANFENLPFYAHILAWDLSLIQDGGDFPVIIFLDHLEECEPSLLEAIRDIIWFLPNVLFVSAGRNRLNWGEGSGDADHIRHTTAGWPGLSKDRRNSRQKLVGRLSSSDSIKFLRESFPENDFTQTQFRLVAKSSGGHPYHLDLIVQRAWFLEGENRLKVEELTITYSKLAYRVISDLTSDQKQALYACCLFRSFDIDIVQIAAGLVNSGPVLNLVEKPIVAVRNNDAAPFFLDRTIRNTLLHLDSNDDDAWFKSEWESAGARAGLALLERMETSEDQNVALHASRAFFSIAASMKIDDDLCFRAANATIERFNSLDVWNYDQFSFRGKNDELVSTIIIPEVIELVLKRQSFRVLSLSSG